MTSFRLFILVSFLILFSINGSSQSIYTRVIDGFTAMAGGKNEWIDLDNDNDLDLISVGSNGYSTLTIVYENVAGTLKQRNTNLPSMSGFAGADYDNDGDTDLLVFNTSSTKLYRNGGGFMFSESLSLGAFNPRSAKWFDFDNDEDLDVLLVGNIAVPKLFENTGSSFIEIVNTSLPNCPTCNSDVADINGDGWGDILLTGNVTSLYLNTSDKKFKLDAATKFDQPTLGSIAAGDFDGDGDFDVLLTGLLNNQGYTMMYENKNGFLKQRNLSLPSVVTDSPTGLLWLNINNDNKIDLFISGNSNYPNPFGVDAKVFRNNGAGVFTDIGDAYLAFDGFSGSYDAGDFDNDGDVDLAFQGTYSALEGFPRPLPQLKRVAGFYRHYQNTSAFVANTKPLPPAVETFSENAFRKEIRLKWGTGSDAETPDGGLFYNFYLKDANKKLIVPSVDFSNGHIRTSNAPNSTGSRGYAFNMPEGALYYAVQSIDGAKEGSVFSAEKMFYHFNGPEAVKATFTDQENVHLSWLDHSSQETNFEIVRSTAPGTGYVSLAILAADTEAYTDNFAFSTETIYYYRIRGYNAQASIYDSLSIVIPNRPTNLTAQSINASRIKLTWADQSRYETSYLIERRQSTGNFSIIATVDSNITQYENTQLQEGTTYEYRVSAKGNNGALAPVTSVSATTNWKPQGVNFDVAQEEDKTLFLITSNFNDHFTDADPSDQLVKIKITSLPENGTLYVYASKAIIGQEITPESFDFIEFKPFTDYVGTTSFSVLPSDGKDYAENNWTISLKFNQVNDPPVFDLLSTKEVKEDFVGDIKIVPQPRYFMGEQEQLITYSLSPEISDIVNVFFDSKKGEIMLTSIKDKHGEVEFTLTANDGQSQSYTYIKKVKVTITPVNDPPVFGSIENIQTDLPSVTIDLDVSDPDNNTTASMFSAFSNNTTIVKREKIKFSSDADGIVQMTIVPEAKVGDTYITVNIYDNAFYVSQTFKFTVTLITGLEDDWQDNIIVFPNPTSENIQISSRIKNESLMLTIRDVSGRKLQSQSLNGLTAAVDLSELTPGIYLLEITDSVGKVTLKKVIKR